MVVAEVRKGFDFTELQLDGLWSRACKHAMERARVQHPDETWRQQYAYMQAALREFAALTEREPYSDVGLHFHPQAKYMRNMP